MLGILPAQDFLSIYQAFLLVFFSMNLTTCREFFSLIEWQMKCLTVFVRSYRWVEDCSSSFLSLFVTFSVPLLSIFTIFLLQWLSLDHATQCPFLLHDFIFYMRSVIWYSFYEWTLEFSIFDASVQECSLFYTGQKGVNKGV